MIPRRSKAAALLLALTAAAAAVGGCSETRQPASVPPTDTGTATTAANRMPFDAYRLSPEQQAQQSVLYTLVRNSCLRKPTPRSGEVEQQIQESLAIDREYSSRRYGISDPTLARTYGYGLSLRTRGASPPQSLSTLSASERRTLAACTARADRIVYGSAQQADSPAASMARRTRDAFEATQRDPRVKAVFARWSACMKAHGYHYADPFKAAGDTHWSRNHATPDALEIDVAKTDVACKKRTRLIETESTVESAYQQRAIEGSESAFAEVRRALEKDAARIRALMRQYAN